MTIAKKSVVWGLFAAGGTVAAFIFPALIALFLLIALGKVPDGLQFEKPAQIDWGNGGGMVVVASHYDTKWYEDIEFVGANDAGSSTGALIELAGGINCFGDKDSGSFRLEWADIDWQRQGLA